MDGKDIWLSPEEWVERYEHRNAVMAERLQQETEE